MIPKLQIFQDFLKEMEIDKPSACARFLTPDFLLIEPPELPQGGEFKGQDAPLKVMAIYQNIWSLTYHDLSFYDAIDSNVLVGRYLIEWTSLETGRSITEPVTELNYFKDDKISRMEVFHYDAEGLLRTMLIE